eukprot:3242609-Rhodomonas_salina.1
MLRSKSSHVLLSRCGAHPTPCSPPLPTHCYTLDVSYTLSALCPSHPTFEQPKWLLVIEIPICLPPHPYASTGPSLRIARYTPKSNTRNRIPGTNCAVQAVFTIGFRGVLTFGAGVATSGGCEP